MRKEVKGYKAILVSFLAGAAYRAGQDSYGWLKTKAEAKKKTK